MRHETLYPYFCNLKLSIKGSIRYEEILELSKRSEPDLDDFVWLIQNKIINRLHFKDKDFHAPHSWLRASGLEGCVVIDIEIVGKKKEEYRFTLHNPVGGCFQLYDETRRWRGRRHMEPIDRSGSYWSCVDLEKVKNNPFVGIKNEQKT